MNDPRPGPQGSLLHAIERWLRWASFALFWLATALVAAMLIHIVLDVFLKYVFNQPVPMTAEMVAHYYMVAVVFLPLPLVELRNASVSVDLFYRMFGVYSRRALMLLAYVGQVFFFGVLAYQSWLDALEALHTRKFVYLDFRLDTWPGTFFLPLGFSLGTLVSLLRLVQVALRPDWEHVVELQSLDDPSVGPSAGEKA